jgi:ATP-dependent RNA circularization protein (DNA/RNA ligase family)
MKPYGIIERKVRMAFDQYEKTQDIHQFARDMARIGDHSVRSMNHWNTLLESIKKVEKEHKEGNEYAKRNG